MVRKDERLTVAAIGEWYTDLLTVDAAIRANSVSAQASSLLGAKLQEREPKIKARVEYLAKKRGLSFDQMWDQLLTGTFERMSPEEYAEVLKEPKED